MNKEDILKRYKAEGKDEGIDTQNGIGDEYGFIVMCIWMLLLMFYKLMNGISIADILSCLFVFLSAGMYKRHALDKSKNKLYLMIGFGIIALIAAVIYYLQTRNVI